MASSTKITEYKRKQRHKRAGRARKAENRNKGTTPAFPIHTDDAVANAEAKK
jgi:hypothetical protein